MKGRDGGGVLLTAFCATVPRMEVAIAEERILVFADRVGAEVAEAKAWAKRVEAFGTLARMSGLLNRPRDEEFEIVYREKRLQPFWRIASHATSKYERSRTYAINLAPEVKRVVIDGEDRAIDGHKTTVTGHESCEEESRRQVLVDGLTGAETLSLAACFDFDAAIADVAQLAALAAQHTVVVPPQVRASGLVRDAVAKALGKIMEPKFLLDIGAEAANLFIPGATVAKLAIVKGLELHGKHRAAKLT